jgi:cholera toxin transcriptional activator
LPQSQNSTTLRFGLFEADLRDFELRKRGVRLKLQEQPFQVLALLLQHAGEVVTREELRQALWPADTFVDFDHSLNTAINKIREVLGDSATNSKFVETIPKRGYRFIGSIETSSENRQTAISLPRQALSPESLNQLPTAPRSVARLLFGLVQVMYLIFYLVALYKLERIHEITAAASPEKALLLQIIILLTAVLAIPTRLYLLSAVSFDYRGLGVKYRRLFPVLAPVDLLWAISPFLMLHVIGVGSAFAATAALLYLPFAQRTLIRMAYEEKTASPMKADVSNSIVRPRGMKMVRATWEDAVLAESNDCVVVEGNQYFPADATKKEHLTPSQHTTVCPWKGTAHYYDVVVNGKTNSNAAWYYPQPHAAAIQIKDRIAFWKGVKVET